MAEVIFYILMGVGMLASAMYLTYGVMTIWDYLKSK